MNDDDLFRRFCSLWFKTLKVYAMRCARGDSDDANDAVQKCLYDQRTIHSVIETQGPVIETLGPNSTLMEHLRRDAERGVFSARIPGYLWFAIANKVTDLQRHRLNIGGKSNGPRIFVTEPGKLREHEATANAPGEEMIASYRNALRTAFTHCPTLDEEDRKVMIVIGSIREADPATSDDKRESDLVMFEKAGVVLSWSFSKVKQRYYRTLEKLEAYLKSSGFQKWSDI